MENHSNGYNGTSTNGHLYSPEQDRSSKSGNVMWQSDSGSAFLRAARSGHMDKVVSFMENGTDINTCNQNGLNALHLSSKEGHVDVVRELLTRGAAVDSVTRKGNAAIHVASLAGQDEVVQLLIQAGTNVNLQSQNGFTPLYMAAQEGHDKVVRNLLQHGANQSITTEDGFTPLAVALQQGHDNVVSVLLEHDCRGKVRLPALHIAAKKDDCKAALLLLQNEQKVDVTSRSGFTPLHIAAHYDNRNMALLLIDRGANVNYEAKHQITPLHVAAKWGRGGMVDLLCARGCVLESRTRDGLTPLHCAARSGHESVIELLLVKGAAISAKTKNGLTPLHMAAQGDHVDSARMLLFHHAPIDDITVDYLTALHVAAHCGHVRVAKLLMERQADASARALNGFTPLHIACKKNRLEVVQLLLKQGADLEATTESGLTPLHVASFMGCMDIVICLLQHKARVDHPTIRGETPLHLAARSNQTDIIRILLKNRAQVDSPAREEQTALHIATRLGNIDTVQLLLQYKAGVNLTTKDSYTPLHIAAKEDQHEVAEVLLNAGASLSAVNSSGFTPLHVSAKYDSVQVAALLIPRGADVNATGKYDVTPLHVAVHYNSHKVALLLLESKASVNVTAKNGFTPLHIAAKNNQIESVTALLEYGADCNSMSQGDYSPLHLAALHAHTDLATLLLAHGARATVVAPGSALTPLHLAAERGEPAMASLLLQHGADTRATSAAGFTPLHVAAHHGHAALVRLLLQHSAEVNPVTTAGYTPLHQAAQQGHTLVINLLLQHRATPEATTNSGQTALSIAERLGYVSVVETLKVVTETTTTTTVSGQLQEIYHVPETMHETFLTDSEDETDAGYLDSAVFGNPSHAKHVILPYYEAKLDMEEPSVTDTSYKYLTVDEMKSLGDESMPMDTSRDETLDRSRELSAELLTVSPSVDELMTSHPRVNDLSQTDSPRPRSLRLDNVDIDRSPVTAGFLVSFMVDARGGAMRGCRHSGVRVIVPPRKAAEPMRITCRYLKKDKLLHPPPLIEGEALASRILEMGPSQAKFLGPVILEVPHFASLRGRQREIVVLRCDDGSTWREHRLEASQQAVQEVLNESFDGAELKQLEDLNTDRITRILTTDFPQYFAIISRLRQEVHAVGPEGGTISSTVVPQVQAVFPAGALTKKIRVGLQAQPLSAELVTEFLGAGITASPIVTIEPRRRKFHKPITLTIPLPQKKRAGVISSTSGNTPSLRLLCSITGGNSAAQWEDVSGSTPLTYISDCVSFTSTVSARFWLIDCRGLPDTPRLATQLYQRANLVPFMAKFVVFAKRVSADRGRLRVFCMTDDREDKTLEHQEHFHEVAKSRDVEVLDGGWVCLECDGNLSCDALAPGSSTGAVNGGCSGRPALKFSAFRENRCSVYVRVVDLSQEPSARLIFTSQEQNEKQSVISTLGVCLPTEVCPLLDISGADSLSRVTSPSVLDNTNDDIPDNLELESGGGGVHSHDTAQRGDENGADEGVDDSSAMNDVQLRHKRHGDDTDAVGKLVNPEIHRAEIRVTDIARALGDDWRALAHRLDIGRSDIELISSEYADDPEQQATVMLRLWMANAGLDATGNVLAESLSDIGREDIVSSCCVNVTMVTNAMEATIAKQRLSQADGFHVAEQKQHDSPHVQRADSEDDDTTPTNHTAVEIDGRHVPDSSVTAERESGPRVIITPRLSPATRVVTVVPGDESGAEQTVSATETAGGQRQSAEDRLSLLQQLGEALDKAEEKTHPTAKRSAADILSEVDGVEPVLESGLREPGQSPVTSIITISNTQSPSTERESGARVIITPRLSPATGVVTVVPGDESVAEQTVSATETAAGQTQSAEDRLNLLQQLGEALDKAEEKTPPTAKQSAVILSEVDEVEPVLESGLREPGQSPVTSIITISNTQSPSTANQECPGRTPPPSPAHTSNDPLQSTALDPNSLTESRQSLPSEGDLQSSEMTLTSSKSALLIQHTQDKDVSSRHSSMFAVPDGACDPGEEFFPAPSVSPVGSIEQGCCPDSSACQDTTCPVSDSSVAPSVDCLLDPECISDTADAERYFRVHADIFERSGLVDEMLISVDSLDSAVARDTGVVVLQSESDSPVVVVDSLDSSVARETGLVVLEDEFDSPVVVVDSLDSLETDLVVLENVAATDSPGNHFHLCVSMNTDQCDEDGVHKTEYQPSTIDRQAEENTEIGEKSFTKPYSTETPFPPSEPHPEEEPHPTGEALSPSGQHPMEIFSPSEPHSIEESHPTEEALPPLEPDPTEKPLSPSEQHPMESFSPSIPHSIEKPYHTEEPFSISERHSAEEPLSISEPRPTEESLPKSEPHPTEEPLSVVESHPTEEPLSVVEPHPTEEPLPVVELYPTEEPLSISEPNPTEEPLSISEPNPTEEPLSISELPRSEELLSMPGQHSTEESLSVSGPHPTEEPLSVSEPHPTEESFSVVEPYPTDEPLSVSEPHPTEEPFSVVEPHPTEEPHSTEEPLSVVGPHSTEESLSLSEPYPTEEPLSVSEPYFPEEPRSISEPHSTEEPPSVSEQHPTEEPLSVSEPLSISEPYPTEEPLSVSEPLSISEPYPTEEPLSVSEPLSISEPYPTEEPPSVSEPLSISEPHSPEEPRSISEANSTEEPHSTEEPLLVSEPHSTEEPLLVSGQHSTEEPLLVSGPHSTEEPLSVVEPYATEEPLSVVEPLSVSEPYPTEKPFSVVEPHPTEEPRSVSEPHSTEEPPSISELYPLVEPLSPSELNQTEELFSTIESEPKPVEGALPSALKEETGARVRAARHVTFDLPSEVSEESEESAVSMETGLVLCESSPVVVRGRTLLQKPHTLHRQLATNLDTAHGRSRTGSSPAVVETTAVVSLMPCFAEFCSSSVEEFADVVQLSSSSSECYSGRRSPLDSTSTSSHHVCTARASSVLVPPPSQFLSDSDQSSRCLCTLDEDCESDSEESSAIYCSLLTDSERVLLEPASDSESALLTDSEREVLVDSECEVMEPVEDYERAVLEPVSEHYGRAELGHSKTTEWSTNADCSVSLSSSSGRSEDLASALCLNSHTSGQMTSADVPDLEFDFGCNMAVPSADFRLGVPSPSVTRRAYSYEPMRELKRDSAISRLLSDPGAGVHLDNTTGGDERAASQSMLPHGLGSSVEDPALNKHDARDS